MQNNPQHLIIHSEPRLNEPYLIAAGPGTANVGLRTADYLREKLEATLFAEIQPDDFFTPPHSFSFRDGLIEIVPVDFGEQAPQNRFYYWQSGKAHDLIIFVGNAHPLPGKVPELAGEILDAARVFGLQRLYMPGAFLTEIHHHSEPRIYGTATDSTMKEYLDSYSIAASPPMNIAHNLNAWLLGMAKSKSIPAVGLVSEIPAYTPEDRNTRACRALARTLLHMLDIAVPDLSDLDAMLAADEADLEQRLAQLRESGGEKATDFLHYIDILEVRGQERAENRTIPPDPETELPKSLAFIEELYARAQADPDRVPELRAAIQQLESTDRLLILRKYGDRIMSLLGYQV